MENRTLLATMIWTNSAGGDWDVASNWVNSANPSDQHVPTSSDDAQINISGITVTHSSNTSDSVDSVTVASGTTLSLSNGRLSIAASSTISGNLTMSGGTLSPAGSLTVSGATTWTGGTINGGGTVTTQGTLTLGSASASDNEFLNGATLDNAGSATLAVLNGNTNYGLYLENSALFDNLPGASFTFQTDAEIYSNGSASITFENEGTLTKAGGTATSPVLATFNQTSTGNLQVQSGTLQLYGGGTISGSLSASSGDTLNFNSGTYNLGASTVLTGAGTVSVTGATVNEAGSYATTGDTLVTSVTSGTINFNGGQVVTMPTLTMSGGILSVTSPASLTVNGAMTWAGGNINGGGTSGLTHHFFLGFLGFSWKI